MIATLRLVAVSAVLVGLTASAPRMTAQSVPTRLIVNARNPVATLRVDQVSQFFLRRTMTWPDGQKVMPVDLEENSPVRISFTRAIHRRSAAALEAFWQQQIFSGRGVPPPEVLSDSEVMDYVRRNPGAIGYVSATAELAPGVRAVAVNP
jgi:ABC-type phosphate transport system substrate-binding protein